MTESVIYSIYFLANIIIEKIEREKKSQPKKNIENEG